MQVLISTSQSNGSRSLRTTIKSAATGLLIGFATLVSSTALAGTDPVISGVDSGFAGASAGDWSTPGNVIGPGDGNCSNMGAIGKVNLTSGFGFDLPSGATITGATAFIKAGSPGGQMIGVQLASNAVIDPPIKLGTQQNLAVTDTQSGNCASTDITFIGPTLAAWGLDSTMLTPLVVNSPNFGAVFTKLEKSTIKVDAICIELNYTVERGSVTQLECFKEAPPPVLNTITVVKNVIGTAPGDDWSFTFQSTSFDLPATGGSRAFTELPNGEYTISETTDPGYNTSVSCSRNDAVVASGTDSVTLSVSGGSSTVCTFTNSEIVEQTLATFRVTKDFTDGVNNTPVTVRIECNGGLILEQSDIITEGAENFVNFVMKDFQAGLLECDITEDAVTGYDTSYVAGGDSPATEDAAGCHFTQIEGGDINTCDVTNDAAAQTIKITKEWDLEGTSAQEIETGYRLVLTCDGEVIASGDETGGNCVKDDVTELSSCKTWNSSGADVFTATVYPEFPNTGCSVTETPDSNYVEVINGCEDLEVSAAGGGDSCTITNLVFFEGIPTLSQYGMAIMALLMLSVGLVGFRRFA